jgi:hypothetical protein
MFIHLFIPTENQPPVKNSKWLVINSGGKETIIEPPGGGYPEVN